MLQAKDVTIALAVISIYAVDFSINVGKYIFCGISVSILTIDQFKRAVGVWLLIHCRFPCNKLDRLGVSLLLRVMG